MTPSSYISLFLKTSHKASTSCSCIFNCHSGPILFNGHFPTLADTGFTNFHMLPSVGQNKSSCRPWLGSSILQGRELDGRWVWLFLCHHHTLSINLGWFQETSQAFQVINREISLLLLPSCRCALEDLGPWLVPHSACPAQVLL